MLPPSAGRSEGGGSMVLQKVGTWRHYPEEHDKDKAVLTVKELHTQITEISV
jgi:hypothetical protein